MTAPKILLDEMGAYYLGDELRFTPDFTTRYATLIASSVRRMKAAAGEPGLAEMVALLRELRENRQHPLHERIAAETQLSWVDSEEMFGIFQQLVDAWIAGMTGTNALASKPASATLELQEVVFEYGNEHDPIATFGRFIVDLSSNASLRLTHYSRGGQRREWQAKQTASVWPDVLAALTTAKFPIAPNVKGLALPPGTSHFSVSGRKLTGEVVSVQLPGGVPFDGYRELAGLMTNIVAQVSDDILGFELPPEPRLVTDVVQTAAS